MLLRDGLVLCLQRVRVLCMLRERVARRVMLALHIWTVALVRIVEAAYSGGIR